MPSAPTTRMRNLADRWLTDEISLSTVTFVADTRPLGKATTTTADTVTVRALIREESGELVDSATVRRNVRELVVWIADKSVPSAAEFTVLTTDEGVTLTTDEGVWLTVDTADAGAETVDVLPTAGQRCTINTCSDATLVGKVGEVTSVDRDSIRAVRRITVRVANDD